MRGFLIRLAQRLGEDLWVFVVLPALALGALALAAIAVAKASGYSLADLAQFLR